MHLGDSDFYDVPQRQLVDKAYAATRFASFDAARAGVSENVSHGSVTESMDTTHLSVVDGAGNAVALTTTINGPYGAGIVVEGAGFLLNNDMDDFSAKPETPNQFGLIGRGEANAIAPRKRMLSSMSPTIVTKDGEVILVTGSPGGSTIITTVLQVIVNVIDHEMPLADAVAKPRFHHQWRPDQVTVERFGFSPDTIGLLEAKGHTLRVMQWGRGIGDANSIMRVGAELHGMHDPRTEGGAVGL